MPDDQRREAAGPYAFDMHSDVPVDVFRRRRAGESGVLAAHHLPRWRQGRVGGAVLIVGGDGASLNPLGAACPSTAPCTCSMRCSWTWLKPPTPSTW